MKEGEHHQAMTLSWRKSISLERSNPWETDSYLYYTLTLKEALLSTWRNSSMMMQDDDNNQPSQLDT